MTTFARTEEPTNGVHAVNGNGHAMKKAKNAYNVDGGVVPNLKEFKSEFKYYSDLQCRRLYFYCPKPEVVRGAYRLVKLQTPPLGESAETIKQTFPNLCGRPRVELRKSLPGDDSHQRLNPLRVGVVLSGGQAPGGHNVITGLHDFLNSRAPGSTLYGFLDGPKGIMQARYIELTAEKVEPHRNQGGFHMIGSGRDKIEKATDLAAAAATVRQLALDGLVIIGGDDSNTNAAFLAEYFQANDVPTCVVGVPKTIDGDLKNEYAPTSFGFDTACKVYSEQIGNIMIDSASARKYYHFVRLMGRSASHITLECALQTHPQWALISEEVVAHNWGLSDIVRQLADIVCARADEGRNYGVFLIPEGVIECMREVKKLIGELNDLLAGGGSSATLQAGGDSMSVISQLSPESLAVFEMLPLGIRMELLLERDPHGNVQVARIETEKLLIKLVEGELAQRSAAGTFSGKFSALPHYFGYEGRCALPTNFDSTYCYTLGFAAAALIEAGETGCMAICRDLHKPTRDWGVGGYPLISMMNVEHRAGKNKVVVKKALVDLEGPVFQAYAEVRDYWARNDCFRSPGPIQFGVEEPESDCANFTLALEINGGAAIHIR